MVLIHKGAAQDDVDTAEITWRDLEANGDVAMCFMASSNSEMHVIIASRKYEIRSAAPATRVYHRLARADENRSTKRVWGRA